MGRGAAGSYPGSVPRTLRPAASILAAGLLLAGCGRSVAVAPLPMSSDQTRQACADLVADLPSAISAGRSWQVEPDPDSTRAWGSPPVVLRCGDMVRQPAATDQLLEVDGVTWLVTTLTQGEEFSTVDRTPGVVVSVPSDYAPTSAVLVELAPTIAAETR